MTSVLSIGRARLVPILRIANAIAAKPGGPLPSFDKSRLTRPGVEYQFPYRVEIEWFGHEGRGAEKEGLVHFVARLCTDIIITLLVGASRFSVASRFRPWLSGSLQSSRITSKASELSVNARVPEAGVLAPDDDTPIAKAMPD